MNKTKTCPCGGERIYRECCGQYHWSEDHHAPTAEALMRSRYCAFFYGVDEYLMRTWHPSTRPAHIGASPPGTVWIGLRIKRVEFQDSTHATVEFIARSKCHGRATRMHETSRFILENDRWYYLDGEIHAK